MYSVVQAELHMNITLNACLMIYLSFGLYVYPVDNSDFLCYADALQLLEVSHIYMSRYGGWE
jgi:hypothetical protein